MIFHGDFVLDEFMLKFMENYKIPYAAINKSYKFSRLINVSTQKDPIKIFLCMVSFVSNLTKTSLLMQIKREGSPLRELYFTCVNKEKKKKSYKKMQRFALPYKVFLTKQGAHNPDK